MVSGTEFGEFANKHASSVLFPLFVGGCCALDTFIPVFPNDFLIAAAVLAQPHRWLYCCTAQTVGVAIGAAAFILLAALLEITPEYMKNAYPSLFGSDTWETTEGYFIKYGGMAALIGGGILPIHPFLYVGALSGYSRTKLVAALTIGRFIRNFLVCYFTASTKLRAKTDTPTIDDTNLKED